LENRNIWEEYKEKIISKLDYKDVFHDVKGQKDSRDDWVVGFCPFHDDKKTRSFGFNKKTFQWACFSKCGKGNLFTYLANTSGMNFKETLFYFGDKLGIPRPVTSKKASKKPPIKEEMVKSFASNLTGENLKYFQKNRGLSDDTLKKYQIGWDAKRKRYTFPIRDENGKLVNVRYYNSKKEPKIINHTDGQHKYGSPARLYGADELAKYQGNQVVLCEGEGDRLLLQQEGFMAVTSTHGCSTFRSEWVSLFKDKDVVIIYDCDREGQGAVNKTVLGAFEKSGIKSIKNIKLPLKGNKSEKDITDYFLKKNFTDEDLQKLIDEAPVHQYIEDIEPEEIIPIKSFTEIEKKEYIDKRVQCQITVCGETSEAFHAVEKFSVAFCNKRDKGECHQSICNKAIKIPHSAQEYIGSCMTNNLQLTHMLRVYCCLYGQRPTLKIEERTTIKEFFCHQRINRMVPESQTQEEIDAGIKPKAVVNSEDSNQELIEKKVYYLSSDNVMPGNYLATGYVKTHPKTQQVTFLIENLVPQEDDYQAFDLAKNIHFLKEYQKIPFKDVLEDFSQNVVKIYERDELLLAVLLTYCSPLHLLFNGDKIRGWLLSVIVGDSGLGKSQSYNKISQFIDVGDYFSSLTGSRTGLAYAMVEHKQKGWQIKRGRYPANSGKIICVDEAQRLPSEDSKTISIGMETGFLKIEKVKSGGYPCKTRLLMICNPKNEKIMDSVPFGCQIIKDIFPTSVIRRLDLAIFCNSGDIEDMSLVNRKHTSNIKARITPEMFRAVVYWTWNLKAEQIIYAGKTEDLCLNYANELDEMYGYATDVPLVPGSDIRNIIARVAAAVAGLRMSANKDFTQLIIKEEHVEAAIQFMKDIYSHDNCCLNDYSEIQKANTKLLDYDEIKAIFIKKREDEKHLGHSYGSHEEGEGSFMRTISILRTNDNIRRDDLADQAGCSTGTIKKIIKLLKRFNLIDSGKSGYYKKPKFNKFLRRFLRECPNFHNLMR
jgi:5S rRNA maturation endonuclease (ribonuclease M5)